MTKERIVRLFMVLSLYGCGDKSAEPPSEPFSDRVGVPRVYPQTLIGEWVVTSSSFHLIDQTDTLPILEGQRIRFDWSGCSILSEDGSLYFSGYWNITPREYPQLWLFGEGSVSIYSMGTNGQVMLLQEFGLHQRRIGTVEMERVKAPSG